MSTKNKGPDKLSITRYCSLDDKAIKTAQKRYTRAGRTKTQTTKKETCFRRFLKKMKRLFCFCCREHDSVEQNRDEEVTSLSVSAAQPRRRFRKISRKTKPVVELGLVKKLTPIFERLFGGSAAVHDNDRTENEVGHPISDQDPQQPGNSSREEGDERFNEGSRHLFVCTPAGKREVASVQPDLVKKLSPRIRRLFMPGNEQVSGSNETEKSHDETEHFSVDLDLGSDETDEHNNNNGRASRDSNTWQNTDLNTVDADVVQESQGVLGSSKVVNEFCSESENGSWEQWFVLSFLYLSSNEELRQRDDDLEEDASVVEQEQTSLRRLFEKLVSLCSFEQKWIVF